MTEQRRGQLDAILERAIERQLSEQRALRQVLEDLRVAVEDVGRSVLDRASHVPVDGVTERWQQELEGSIGRLADEMVDLRTVLDPHHEVTASVAHTVKALREEVSSTRDALGGMSSDVDGIAKALVDLNTGLRDWAKDLEASVSSLREVADSLEPPPQQPVRPPTVQGEGEVDAVVGGEVIERIEGIQQQLKETADLSLYLSDQIEDLDRLIGRLGELPEHIEGIITQGLRRALTAKAKLDQEAAGAVDEAVEALEETFEQLDEVLADPGLQDVRKLSLGQVELTSRVEALHELLGDRLGELELETQRNLEALAKAIDRLAAGREPKALAAISRPVKAKAKPKAKPKAKTKPKAKPKAKTKPKAKAKPRKRRSTRAEPPPAPTEPTDDPED